MLFFPPFFSLIQKWWVNKNQKREACFSVRACSVTQPSSSFSPLSIHPSLFHIVTAQLPFLALVLEKCAKWREKFLTISNNKGLDFLFFTSVAVSRSSPSSNSDKCYSRGFWSWAELRVDSVKLSTEQIKKKKPLRMNVWGNQLVTDPASYKNWYVACAIIPSGYYIKNAIMWLLSGWDKGKPFSQISSFIFCQMHIPPPLLTSHLHLSHFRGLSFSSLLILSFPCCRLPAWSLGDPHDLIVFWCSCEAYKCTQTQDP